MDSVLGVDSPWGFLGRRWKGSTGVQQALRLGRRRSSAAAPPPGPAPGESQLDLVGDSCGAPVLREPQKPTPKAKTEMKGKPKGKSKGKENHFGGAETKSKNKRKKESRKKKRRSKKKNQPEPFRVLGPKTRGKKKTHPGLSATLSRH